MKRQAYTVIAMIVLGGSMAVATKAQSFGGTHLVANIPFQFNVGNKILPAGEYQVWSINDSSKVVLIQSQNGKASAMLRMSTVERKSQDRTMLIFNRYGNHYFLAQTWVYGATSGLQAPKSRAERAAERDMAG